jgi:hypothetical protein
MVKNEPTGGAMSLEVRSAAFGGGRVGNRLGGRDNPSSKQIQNPPRLRLPIYTYRF